MTILLIVATIADLALGVLLVAVSGFILQGVNNTGPMDGAIWFVLMVLLCFAAPVLRLGVAQADAAAGGALNRLLAAHRRGVRAACRAAVRLRHLPCMADCWKSIAHEFAQEASLAALKQEPLFAARLNSFKVGAEQYWPGKNRITTADLIARAATVEGLNAADLNYPDHFAGTSVADLKSATEGCGVALNGLAMRYYTEPGFKLGAFTHPDPAVRQAAVDLTRRGIDTLAQMGGSLMTLWMGQDGFDYSFQGDYARMWDTTVEALDAVCAHDRDHRHRHRIQAERAALLFADAGRRRPRCWRSAKCGAANLGVTLDFAHVLYADEMPAIRPYLVARHSRLLGVHLNDGYGKRDDGLMVGERAPGADAGAARDAGADRLWRARSISTPSPIIPGSIRWPSAARTSTWCGGCGRSRPGCAANAELAAAIERQDAPASQAIVNAALYGSGK